MYSGTTTEAAPTARPSTTRESTSTATVGGGGAPGVDLPSAAVVLPEHYAKTLRTGPDPVLGRIERGECLLDLRALEPDEDEALHAAVLEAHRCG